MTKRNPFTFPQPIPGADKLTAEDRRQIDIVAELAAAIFALTAKENGFGDAEITRARKAAMTSSPALSLTSVQPVLGPNPYLSAVPRSIGEPISYVRRNRHMALQSSDSLNPGCQ